MTSRTPVPGNQGTFDRVGQAWLHPSIAFRLAYAGRECPLYTIIWAASKRVIAATRIIQRRVVIRGSPMVDFRGSPTW